MLSKVVMMLYRPAVESAATKYLQCFTFLLDQLKVTITIYKIPEIVPKCTSRYLTLISVIRSSIPD